MELLIVGKKERDEVDPIVSLSRYISMTKEWRPEFDKVDWRNYYRKKMKAKVEAEDADPYNFFMRDDRIKRTRRRCRILGEKEPEFDDRDRYDLFGRSNNPMGGMYQRVGVGKVDDHGIYRNRFENRWNDPVVEDEIWQPQDEHSYSSSPPSIEEDTAKEFRTYELDPFTYFLWSVVPLLSCLYLWVTLLFGARPRMKMFLWPATYFSILGVAIPMCVLLPIIFSFVDWVPVFIFGAGMTFMRFNLSWRQIYAFCGQMVEDWHDKGLRDRIAVGVTQDIHPFSGTG